MKTNDILSEKQKLILELLKRNNINKLKDFINSLETPLYFLNSTNFDLLTLALSLNCSFYIIKLIFNRCNYKTLNYVVKDKYYLYDMKVLMYSNNNVKSPLLLSLEFSDFQSVELLINKGADMYFKINGNYILEILREENLLTMRKLNFLLKNGFTGISKRKFIHIINNEINKIEIPMELYLKYLDKKDYKKVEYLYKYYSTEKKTLFKDFILFYLNYFDRNFNKKSFYDLFNFIINHENTFIFKAFLKKNNYILQCLYSSESEILNLINEHNVSSDVVDILRKYFLI
ncbi:hypothetical protein H8356DRAFT_1289541 [Neocallimastix lanati (nom. inval.)]|nr:hypothetical protein H8356DRAFT_1289541 [Neocallimastix sp. JGI-2020a]